MNYIYLEIYHNKYYQSSSANITHIGKDKNIYVTLTDIELQNICSGDYDANIIFI